MPDDNLFALIATLHPGKGAAKEPDRRVRILVQVFDQLKVEVRRALQTSVQFPQHLESNGGKDCSVSTMLELIITKC